MTRAATTWDKAKSLLCVRLDAMGDVLMTGPALQALKEQSPARKLTLLTSPSGAAAAKLMPWIDDVISVDVPWMKSASGLGVGPTIHALVERLKHQRFDAAVIFTVYTQSPLPAAMICTMADIPLKLAHCRENPYHLLTDWIKEPEPHEKLRHEVRRQLDLIESISGLQPNRPMQICIDPEFKAQIIGRVASYNGRWLLMHPGATAATRRYPSEGWVAIAKMLYYETGFTLIFTGNLEEANLIDDIRGKANVPSISFAGQLQIQELATLIGEARLLICNNTGPSHLAAATSTPVVCLYALTNPQHTPWMTPSRILFHDVECRYCYKSVCPQKHHHCLRKVMPSQVVDAALSLLDSAGDGPNVSPNLPGLVSPPLTLTLPTNL